MNFLISAFEDAAFIGGWRLKRKYDTSKEVVMHFKTLNFLLRQTSEYKANF